MIRTLNIASRQHKLSFKMDLEDDDPVLRAFHNGCVYESEVAHVLLRTLRPGDTFVDVGANNGFFTLLGSLLVGPTGTVHAFEPGENALPELLRNVEANRLENVKIHTVALWSDVEPRAFYLNSDSSGGNAFWNPGLWRENLKSAKRADVRTVRPWTLDQKLGPRRVRLIKLDTEGADCDIMCGGRSLDFDFVVSELNPFGQQQLGASTSAYRLLMRQRNLQAFLIHPDGALPTLVPPKTEISHLRDVSVLNVLFSTLDNVAEAWPRAPYE